MRPNFRPLVSFVLGVALLPAAAFAETPGPSAVMTDGRGIPTIAPVLERTTDAVVNIAVERQGRGADSPLFRDPFFRRFFGGPDRFDAPGRRTLSAGSGVIVDAEAGYVLTNHHVVERAGEVRVTLKDRREVAAEVIGSDPETDIAVLQIEADGLSALPLGDSDALKVGDFVVAVGNPFGLGQTVTSGIVSALGRTGINPDGYEDFIQTDASINPGNSGGALVTLDGKLVGINTAIVSPAGGNVGIGFAVPINIASAILEQIVDTGAVSRGRLGVTIQDLTRDLADALDARARRGAVVAEVAPGTAAAEAGLRPGDIIVSVDGVQIDGAGDLRNRIGLAAPGTPVRIGLERNAARLFVEATLGRVDDGRQAGGPAALGDLPPALAGIEFEPLGPGFPGFGDVDGVLVTDVARGSPAAMVGLSPGDVVTSVNGAPVADLGALGEALDGAGRVVALGVYRDGFARLVVLAG